MSTEAAPPRLLDRIRRSLTRDQGLPLTARIRKAVRFGVTSALAPLYLSGCDEVGPGARTRGRPTISNAGRIEIGARAHLGAMYGPLLLSTGPQGKIEIGDDVILNFGSSISARSLVKLGDRVSFGPHVTVDDADGEAGDDTGPQPIFIGNDVWLATRVKVRKGAVIGDGSVIAAGSEVSGEIPAGVVAGGVPARVIRRLHGADRAGERAGETPSFPRTERSPRESEVPAVRGLLTGDFDLRELAVHLRTHDPLGPRVEPVVAASGQWVQALHRLGEEAVTPGADFAVVWTHPESIASFRELVLGRSIPIEDILAEVDLFAARIRAAAASIRHLLVPSWVLPPFERGLGMSDMREGGLARTLLRMNLRLAEALDGTPNVVVLDAARWVAAAGPAAMSSKLWFLGRVDFSARVLAEAALDIRAALRGLSGAERKLLVLGLENTLRRHAARHGKDRQDPAGEAFDELQHRVEALRRRGVLVAKAGEGETRVASIVDLSTRLDLPLRSVVFLGDDAEERARVREALPEVFVPEWPADEMLFSRALLALRCFDAPAEDRARVDTYRPHSIESYRQEAPHA